MITKKVFIVDKDRKNIQKHLEKSREERKLSRLGYMQEKWEKNRSMGGGTLSLYRKWMGICIGKKSVNCKSLEV